MNGRGNMHEDDIERLLALVQNPAGDDAALRLRLTYFRDLVGAGASAEARVSQAVRSGRGANLQVLMDLLAAFESRDAAEVLRERLEAGPEVLSEAAAEALARHPTRWAVDALYHGIQSRKAPAVLAALSALRSAGGPPRCESIVPLLRNQDRRIRFQAVHVAWTGRCVSAAELRDLFREEPDPEIRELIDALLAAAGDGGAGPA